MYRFKFIAINFISGHSSVVERNLAKVDVARSNRVARFKLFIKFVKLINSNCPHRLEA
jgi:hypothetical protein